ncbi:MAG: Ldh family oxidoreductase [Lawsonibacter sp.]|nr:Ldh family oxidoreductase [Lawsonibacter sp.]
MKVSAQRLHTCIQTILESTGESRENAGIAADLMVKCDMRGGSTHGSHMLNLIYARRKVGQLSFPTKIETIREDGAVAVLDGGDGLGQVAVWHMAELAVQKAKRYGVSAVLLRRTNNAGALGPYVERVAEEGMVCLLFCNASPAMAPWGGRTQFFGTQPFAIGIYTGTDTIFSADMATAQVARGKIRKAARDHKEIPSTWALDRSGEPTTDPVEAIKGILLPIGGPKGSAIALAIDIVAGLISGSSYAPDVKAIHYPEGEAGVGCGMIALNIEHFMDMQTYLRQISLYLSRVKAVEKAKGVEEILLPGETKQRRERLAAQDGVDLPEEEFVGINQALTELKQNVQLEPLELPLLYRAEKGRKN